MRVSWQHTHSATHTLLAPCPAPHAQQVRVHAPTAHTTDPEALRELRQLYDTLAHTVRELSQIAALLLFLLAVYAVLAVRLFSLQASPLLRNVWVAASELFVLLSGE